MFTYSTVQCTLHHTTSIVRHEWYEHRGRKTASKSPHLRFYYFLSMSQQAVSAVTGIIQNSARVPINWLHKNLGPLFLMTFPFLTVRVEFFAIFTFCLVRLPVVSKSPSFSLREREGNGANVFCFLSSLTLPPQPPRHVWVLPAIFLLLCYYITLYRPCGLA